MTNSRRTSRGPVPGRDPAVEKHWSSQRLWILFVAHSPIQWVPGAFPPELATKRQVDHLRSVCCCQAAIIQLILPRIKRETRKKNTNMRLQHRSISPPTPQTCAARCPSVSPKFVHSITWEIFYGNAILALWSLWGIKLLFSTILLTSWMCSLVS